MLEDHSEEDCFQKDSQKTVFTKNVQCDLESDHPLDNSLDKSGKIWQISI